MVEARSTWPRIQWNSALERDPAPDTKRLIRGRKFRTRLDLNLLSADDVARVPLAKRKRERGNPHVI